MASAPKGLGDYRGAAGRAAFLVGALALAASIFLPYWQMRVAAPQYPKGLTLTVHLHVLTGDVREIDSLNHYIGMRPLAQGAQLERRLAVPGVGLIIACLVLAALLPRRWALWLAIPAVLLPVLFAGDLYLWLRDYGLHLDPHAPLNRSIKPFVPTLLGAGRIAQFTSYAGFRSGFFLAAAAGVLALVGAWLRKAAGPSRRALALVFIPWALLAAPPAQAGTIVVAEHAPIRTISEALVAAADGDTIIVRGGIHPGPIIVRKRIVLQGEGWPVLDGGGIGTVVEVAASDAIIRGMVIRNSGDRLATSDAGILVTAPRVTLEANRIEDTLFGIVLRQAQAGVVRGNRITGKALPVARRGDAIRVWYSDDVVIEDNDVHDVRDLVLWYARRVRVRENRIRRARYGLHFMYCEHADVTGNVLEDNSVGAYLMYSTGLRLRGNRMISNRGPSGYGVGLKDLDGSVVEGNVIADNRVGIFLEHATADFIGNVIGGNDVGLRVLPSAMGNAFTGNTLMDNGEQVDAEPGLSLATNRWVGNYWSDYRGWDADQDGTGEAPYRAARLFERLTDRYPSLRLYADSPAAQAIELAARMFPLFAPKPLLEDPAPRMRPMGPGARL